MAVTSGVFPLMFILLLLFLTPLHSVHVKVENSSEFFTQHYVHGGGIILARRCSTRASSGLVCLPVCPFVRMSVWLRLGSLIPQAVRQGGRQWKSKRGDTNASLIDATSSPRQHHCISLLFARQVKHYQRVDPSKTTSVFVYAVLTNPTADQPVHCFSFISTCAQVFQKPQKTCYLPLSALFTVLPLRTPKVKTTLLTL